MPIEHLFGHFMVQTCNNLSLLFHCLNFHESFRVRTGDPVILLTCYVSNNSPSNNKNIEEPLSFFCQEFENFYRAKTNSRKIFTILSTALQGICKTYIRCLTNHGRAKYLFS